MFEQTFKNLDDILRKEAGCATELDYAEQTSWLLFLKYVEDLEAHRQVDAELTDRAYAPLFDDAHRWTAWARNEALTGDDLIEFVDRDLFPYLKGFRHRATGVDTIDYKIGEIFSEITNRFRSGYSLRDAVDRIDELRFRSQAERHELSHLYETRIRNMGNAGRNGGEYYTPRPLIRAMIKVVDPRVGETIYDPACGSAGFLCEAYEHLRARPNLSTGDIDTLQRHTFTGKEKKSLAYVIAIMNLILHGLEAPRILHANTLTENLADVQARDQYDVILANPPFGGKERGEVQGNFPIKSGETAYLFLQHMMKRLKPGGRAAVVIKNTFLSNGDAAALRRELLATCNLHSVLDLPQGSFLGAGVKTVVLFFEKGAPTRSVWYYQLDPGRSLGKTTALTDADFDDFVGKANTREDSDRSWSVAVDDIDAAAQDLSPRNPNTPEEAPLRSPKEILAEIRALDAESAVILARIDELLEA